MRTVFTAAAVSVGIWYLILASALLSAVGIGGFHRLIGQEIVNALVLSLVTAAISTSVVLSFAIPVSYALSRFTFVGHRFIDLLVDVPIVLSPVATGLALLFVFAVPPFSFLKIGVGNPLGIVVAQAVVILGFATRLLKSTFDGIDRRYGLVARSLGSSAFKAFMDVELPMAKHGILAAGIMCFARAMGEFGATVTLVGMSHRTETLPIGIAMSLFRGDITSAAGMSFILILSAMIALLSIRFIGGAQLGRN